MTYTSFCPSALHGPRTSRLSKTGSIRRSLSSEAVLSRLRSQTRTRKTTRQAFVQWARSLILKVCLISNTFSSTLTPLGGVSASAKASTNDKSAVDPGAKNTDGMPSISQGLGGKVWPAYANIVYGSTGEVGILGQTDEVKTTIRKAIYFMEEFIIFENAFPDLATRATWARKSLLKAVNDLAQSKLTDYDRYLVIKKRLKEDPEYVRSLSAVVRENWLRVMRADFSSKLEQRISNFRRGIKRTSAAAVRSSFLLHMKPQPPHDADTLVKDITNYICPLAVNVSGIRSTGPSLCSCRERTMTMLSLMRTMQ